MIEDGFEDYVSNTVTNYSIGKKDIKQNRVENER